MGVIETRPPGYLVHVTDHSLDLGRFDDLVKQSLPASGNEDVAGERRCLRQALELWRGPVLSNVDSEALHRDVIPALKERRPNVLQRRFDLELRLGGTDEVTAELQKLTMEHPLRERYCAQLMLGLYRAGRQAEALEVYRRVRDLLADELGIEPGKGRCAICIRRSSRPTPTHRCPGRASHALGAAGLSLAPHIGKFVGRTDTIELIKALVVVDGLRPATPIVTRRTGCALTLPMGRSSSILTATQVVITSRNELRD